jgi:hypothetical protein
MTMSGTVGATGEAERGDQMPYLLTLTSDP